jgi:DNA-binding response OmpR family regulator
VTVTQASDKKTVLVVEDEDSLRFAMTYILKANGYKVEESNNGNLAYEKAQQVNPDVIVSDVCMPHLDGVHLLKKIREKDAKNPLFFLVTGFSQVAPFEGYDMGADGIFAKPFDRVLLLSSIKEKLRPLQDRLRGADDMVLAPTLKADNVQLGRGGCFVPGMGSLLQEQTHVDFSVTVAGQPQLQLEGRGIIRWVRHKTDGNLPMGCGLEFEKLTAASLENYQKYLDQHAMKAFIPQGS